MYDGRLPSLGEYIPQNALDNTANANKPRQHSFEDFANRNKELSEKNKKLRDQAIENTAKKIVDRRHWSADGKKDEDPIGRYAEMNEVKNDLQK